MKEEEPDEGEERRKSLTEEEGQDQQKLGRRD